MAGPTVFAGRAQIGAELYISPKTASVHVTSILRKLGVSGRAQAAALAERAGQALRGQLGGQFRAAPPGQRHPGGSRELAGQRDHRSPVHLADPPRPPRITSTAA